jgi:hypothetical protein
MHEIVLVIGELCAVGICVQLILLSDERVQRSPVWIERDRQRILGYQDDMYRESVATWVRTLYRHEWFKNLRKP